jgi:hypothetical protein
VPTSLLQLHGLWHVLCAAALAAWGRFFAEDLSRPDAGTQGA